MHETFWPQGQELLGVEWQQFPENTFQEPVITKAKQEGIKSSQPEASKKAYTPPHLRGNTDKPIPQPKSTIPGLPPGKRWQYWHKSYDTKNPIRRRNDNEPSSSKDTRPSHKNNYRYNPYQRR